MLVQRGAAAAVAAVAVPIIFLGFERVRTVDASIMNERELASEEDVSASRTIGGKNCGFL